MSLFPNSGRVSRLRGVAATVAAAALTSCGAVPDLGPTVEQASANPQAPHIVTPRGPLSVRESRKIIARLARKPGERSVLERHAAIEEALAERPLVGGNRTRILRDGWQTFPAMFRLMRAARSSINLEYYILEDIETGGERLSDLLISKRREGVTVNMLYDAYGSGDTPHAFFECLRAAGVRLLEFNPLDPLKARTPYAPNDRDHRKILIVDGAHAIVGGVNLSTKYQSNPIGKSSAPASDANLPWRDTDIEIDGPAVADLQSLFLDHWRAQRGRQLDSAGFFPQLEHEGPAVVRVLGSAPNDKDWSYYASALSAIRNAEKSIELTAAYFVPTPDEMEALEHAAERGVDVRILLPDHTDSDLATDVAHSRYEDLLEVGVKIFETHGVVLHSKTLVIDGVWSIVGSSNFDHRSVLFNDEVDVVVLGSATAKQLHEIFESDLAKATRITPEAWANRPLGEKIDEYLARFTEALL